MLFFSFMTINTYICTQPSAHSPGRFGLPEETGLDAVYVLQPDGGKAIREPGRYTNAAFPACPGNAAFLSSTFRPKTPRLRKCPFLFVHICAIIGKSHKILPTGNREKGKVVVQCKTVFCPGRPLLFFGPAPCPPLTSDGGTRHIRKQRTPGPAPEFRPCTNEGSESLCTNDLFLSSPRC